MSPFLRLSNRRFDGKYHQRVSPTHWCVLSVLDVARSTLRTPSSVLFAPQPPLRQPLHPPDNSWCKPIKENCVSKKTELGLTPNVSKVTHRKVTIAYAAVFCLRECRERSKTLKIKNYAPPEIPLYIGVPILCSVHGCIKSRHLMTRFTQSFAWFLGSKGRL